MDRLDRFRFQNKQQGVPDLETYCGFKLSSSELEQMDHNFLYMIVKYSKIPIDIIVDIKIEFSSEEPKYPDDWKIMQPPIYNSSQGGRNRKLYFSI